MHLETDHLWTTIHGSYPKGVLDPVTSYMVDGYWFSNAYKKGHWDGRSRFIEKIRNRSAYRFPTGFLPLVCTALAEANFGYTLEDHREFPDIGYEAELAHATLGTIRLDEGKYDYQAEALQAALTHGRGTLWMATGAGKTEVGAAIFKSVGKRSLFLTHRLNLAHQTRERLAERLERPVGIVCGEEHSVEEVTVGMVQSLSKIKDKKILEWMKGVQCLIGDEVHHLESDQWYKNFGAIPAPYRFGLTATPNFDGPGLALVGMCGPAIYHISAVDLILRDVLVPPRIWFHPIKDDNYTFRKEKAYQTVYSNGVVWNTKRNQAIVTVARQFKHDEKSCITLVKRINHGNLLADMLCQAGIKTEFIQGKTPRLEREKFLQQLWDGELDHIVAVAEIMGEGSDFPELRALINATGSKGGLRGEGNDQLGRTTVQILGRLLRKAPGKLWADYVDMADQNHEFLRKASLARVQTLERQGYMPFVKYWADYTP